MILLIDNYDSFSWNLYQMLGEHDPAIRLVRRDELTVRDILDLNPTGLVLSPGSGRPEAAGGLMSLVQTLAGRIPILGVGLGHEIIAAAFGASIVKAKRLLHGRPGKIRRLAEEPLFDGLPEVFIGARYHSLAVSAEDLPSCLSITAVSDDEKDRGEIMAIRHNTFPVFGVQFDPESVMTPEGHVILSKYLTLCSQEPH